MNAILIAAERAATARSASLLLHLFDLGHALLVEEMIDAGVPVPERFLAGDSPRDVGPAGDSDLADDEAES